MVLSRPDILRRIKQGGLAFDPPVEDGRVAQVSVDLRLGRRFSFFRQPPPPHIRSIRVSNTLWASTDIWQHVEQDEYLLEPGSFVLAQTLESVRVPPDLMGLVEGRSSWARVGVTIHITAPKIDPGFDGQITLEMATLDRYP